MQKPAPIESVLEATEPGDQASFGAPLSHVSPEISVAGHQLRLFSETAGLMEAMVEDIRSARQKAWVECYIICDDAAGQVLAAALKERAREGVDCRVMYDAVGCISTPRAFFDDLANAGVHVHEFHTLWNVVQRFASLRPFNRRNHRKLTVVDDRIAYFGGMNIVDQRGIQSDADMRRRHLPTSAGWRDVHLRLTGPQQAEIAACMDVHWRSQHGERVRWPRWQIREMLACRDEGLFFFDSAPRFRKRHPWRVLRPLLRRAREQITLSMAYFIPVGAVMRELLRARDRQVDVTVIVPEHSDVPLVQWASQYLYEKLLRNGIRIFEREDLMLHGKAMVLDDAWSVVGSCNLDPRSLRLNTEFLAVIRSSAAAEQIRALCQYEIEHSHEVVLDHCHRRAWWQRLRDRMAWTLRRWL